MRKIILIAALALMAVPAQAQYYNQYGQRENVNDYLAQQQEQIRIQEQERRMEEMERRQEEQNRQLEQMQRSQKYENDSNRGAYNPNDLSGGRLNDPYFGR